VPKILIADDNSNVQKTVALVFQERGVQVVSVGNGEAAVRRIPDLDPDLVLADIFMPVRNGYEVCEFVKKDQRFSHIPVILLVGAFDPLDEKEARRAGADGILKKPFVPPDALIAMVMSALEKSPRAAAELAKAKEAKEAPEPHPMPQLEVPARKESKPLPNFPEPAPEEAPLAYGFGGSRSLSAEKKEAPTEPIALTAEPAADDAEFDAAADWRRDARDFEIPAEAANLPAFSSGDDWEPTPSSSQSDEVPDAIAPREADLPATVPFAAQALSELETSADNFFEPEPLSEAPAPPQDSAEPSFTQSWTAPRLDESSASESHGEHTSDTPAQQPHWMDAVAASGSQHPQSDWMRTLGEQQAEGGLADVPGQLTASEANSALADTGEEPFFADEPEASEPAKSLFVPEPPAPEVSNEFDARPFETVGFQATQFFPSEIDRASTNPVFFKDPALVEPPAVHVTPEPLLVNEEPRQSPEYGSHVEELPPAHSFLVPEDNPTIAEESAAQDAEERHDVPVPLLSAGDVDERIPTIHPPNREVLADIPFLVPPPGFRPDAPPQSAAASDAVDAVVQKVLEKLEPQLHELLSKGVLKPLVESLLQGELAKKER
jgi:CheY-like chemotaxis protein